jgi:hypothetical protein
VQRREEQLAELRREIAVADAEFARGDYIEIDGEEAHRDFFDELKAELEEFIAQERRPK